MPTDQCSLHESGILWWPLLSPFLICISIRGAQKSNPTGFNLKVVVGWVFNSKFLLKSNMVIIVMSKGAPLGLTAFSASKLRNFYDEKNI